MSVTSLPIPKSAGLNLDIGEKAFGLLESSGKIVGNRTLLRERLSEEGYLYLAGFLDRDAVLRARDSITGRLAAEGLLHPDYPPFDGVAKPDQRTVFRPDLAFRNRAIESLIYGTRVIEFYRALLGGPIRHYDFTWFRPIGPGKGTPPHCDLVYMGRGTNQVFTLWVPYGDITLDLGGLMILEGSHKKSGLLRNYLRRDVDLYCLNRPGAEEAKAQERSLWNGW
jgi:ectoine hydroxylase-related dioxygenase (phytanoyl-CoA dioxygenase family)